MRVVQVRIRSGAICRPSSIRKSTALRRRRFQGRSWAIPAKGKRLLCCVFHPFAFILLPSSCAPVVKWDHSCLSNSSTGSKPRRGATAAQAQADVRLSCKQRAAGSRPASGSNRFLFGCCGVEQQHARGPHKPQTPVQIRSPPPAR